MTKNKYLPNFFYQTSICLLLLIGNAAIKDRRNNIFSVSINIKGPSFASIRNNGKGVGGIVLRKTTKTKIIEQHFKPNIIIYIDIILFHLEHIVGKKLHFILLFYILKDQANIA